MIINISGKHIEVSEKMQNIISKKLRKLDRYFEATTKITVVLSEQKQRQIMEVTIPFDGMIIRAEETSNDKYANIDSIVKKLLKQIHHHRSKLEKRFKRGAFHGEGFEYESEDMVDQTIVKTKKFPIKPVDIEEAIMQMNLLGHSFFVFVNVDTDTVNVLYTRKDGQLGLLEPEY